MLNDLNMRMTMPFESMWLIQGAYAECHDLAPLYNPPDNMSPAETFLFRRVPEDFNRMKPSLLIVDNVTGITRCQGATFDYRENCCCIPLFANRHKAYDTKMNFDS